MRRRQITAGSFEGNPKWLTINRNQDVLNYAGAAGLGQQPGPVQHRVLGDAGDRLPGRSQGGDAGPGRAGGRQRSRATTATRTARSCSPRAAPASRRRPTSSCRRPGSRCCCTCMLAVIVLCFITFRSWRAVVVAVVPLVLTSILCEALMVALGIGRQGGHAAGDRAGRGHRRRLRALSAFGAARAATRGRHARRGLQERRPVHRQGRRAGRHHARGRRDHLGVLADQVPGRHGDPAHVHVPVEHARAR